MECGLFVIQIFMRNAIEILKTAENDPASLPSTAEIWAEHGEEMETLFDLLSDQILGIDCQEVYAGKDVRTPTGYIPAIEIDTELLNATLRWQQREQLLRERWEWPVGCIWPSGECPDSASIRCTACRS